MEDRSKKIADSYNDKLIDYLCKADPKTPEGIDRIIHEIDMQIAACTEKSKQLTREIRRVYPQYLSHD